MPSANWQPGDWCSALSTCIMILGTTQRGFSSGGCVNTCVSMSCQLTCSPIGPGRPGNPLDPSSPFWPNIPCWPLGPASPSLPWGRSKVIHISSSQTWVLSLSTLVCRETAVWFCRNRSRLQTGWVKCRGQASGVFACFHVKDMWQ